MSPLVLLSFLKLIIDCGENTCINIRHLILWHTFWEAHTRSEYMTVEKRQAALENEYMVVPGHCLDRIRLLVSYPVSMACQQERQCTTAYQRGHRYDQLHARDLSTKWENAAWCSCRIHTFTVDIAQIQLIGVKSVKTIPSKNKLKVIEQNRRVAYQLFFRDQILIEIGPKQYF